MIYRSKPSEVEAVQWIGDNWEEMRDFAGVKVDYTALDLTSGERVVELKLLAGKDGAQEWVPVPKGHWLVMQPGDKSDIWPVDPEYFANKYEEGHAWAVVKDPEPGLASHPGVDPYFNLQIRNTALHEACNVSTGMDETIANAKRFYEFLKGDNS
jgi:hypothetical protein